MTISKGNLTGKRKWILLLLLVVPLAVIAMKTLASPHAHLAERISLNNLPESLDGRVRYILVVPLGAILVVFFRLTLGIRVLGPFRSVLLAIAFQITGILLGLIFLTVVIGIIAIIRPPLKAIKLPYFARVSVILSSVATTMIVALVAAEWFQVGVLSRVAYFPIVVLCLTGDGFARTLYREGLASAAWRGTMTALIAVLITFITALNGFDSLMLRFPELLLLEIGFIILIAEFFDFRLLQALNPKVENGTADKKKGVRKGRKKSRAVSSLPRGEKLPSETY